MSSDEPQTTAAVPSTTVAVESLGERINMLDTFVAQVGALNTHLDHLSDAEYSRYREIVDVDSKRHPEKLHEYVREMADMSDQASWRTERPKSARSREQRIEDIFSLLPGVHQRREGATRLYKELQPELERLVQEELDAEKAPAPSRIEQLKAALKEMKGE